MTALEIHEHRTETQRIEDAITKACHNLAAAWPHMIRPGETQPPGMASRSGILLEDDHDPRDTDQRRVDRTLSLRRFAQDQLNAWCRLIIEDRPVHHGIPSGHDIPGMCDFITRHAQWLSGHEAAPDAQDELHALAHSAHLIAWPKRRDSISIGSCPLEIPGEMDVLETCNGNVRVKLGTNDNDGWAACSRCGEVAVASWWEERMYGDPELRRWFTDADVVTFVHRTYGEVIKQATVRQWVKRGVLTASDKTTDDGRRLFEREAVVLAIDFHKRRGA